MNEIKTPIKLSEVASVEETKHETDDVTLPSVSTLMQAAKAIIEENDDDSLLKEWHRLSALIHRMGFSVAVAGEFSRGKSTLINRLLDKEWVPVGGTPTTAMLTRILYGSQPILWRIHSDSKQRERLEPTDETWQTLTADDDGHESEDVLELEIPHPWLKQTGIQLLDTPGAGDLIGSRAAIAIDAIAQCDATLVAINATMAMSLTEKTFIEEHILSRKIPRVAVVLTRLDQIRKKEHQKVIEFVRNRLQELAPSAELWCAHGMDVLSAEVDVAGPEKILHKLAEWAAAPDHVKRRAIQIISHLKYLLEILRESLKTRLSALQATAEERTKALKAAEEALSRRKLDWEDLRLEMEKREIACADWVEQRLRDAKGEIVASLANPLRHASSPSEWCQQELPYQLHKELRSLAQSVNGELSQRMIQDTTWLQGEVVDKFSWTLNLVSSETSVDLENQKITIDASQFKDLDNLERMDLITKVGIGVGIGVSVIFFRPLLIMGTLMGGVMLDKFFKAQLDKQRQEIVPALEQVVENVLFNATGTIQEQLSQSYRSILTQTQEQESLWFTKRQEALQQGNEAADASEQTEILSQRTENVVAFIQELINWMEKVEHDNKTAKL